MFAAYVLLLCGLPCYFDGYSFNNVYATLLATALITSTVGLTTVAPDLAITFKFILPCLFLSSVPLHVLLAGALCESAELLQHLDLLPGVHHTCLAVGQP